MGVGVGGEQTDLKCVHELKRLVKCRVQPKVWHSARGPGGGGGGEENKPT